MVTGRTKSFWMEHISEKKTVLYILKVLLRHRKYNRKKHSCTYVTIGYDNGKYLDLIFDRIISLYSKNCVEGSGTLNEKNFGIEVNEYSLKTFK